MLFKSNFMTKNAIPFFSYFLKKKKKWNSIYYKILFKNKIWQQIIYISICLIIINNYLQI